MKIYMIDINMHKYYEYIRYTRTKEYDTFLNDQITGNVATHFGWISTADLVSTHGNCTSSSPETSAEVLEKEVKSPVTSKRLKGYFYSDTVFNLSKKVLTETEIGVLERGLGFVPTPNLMRNEESVRGFRLF